MKWNFIHKNILFTNETEAGVQTLCMAVYVFNMEKGRWNVEEKTMQSNMNAEVLNWFSARQR